jgi:hypothetical protein
MKVAIILSLAAIIAGLASGRSTANYDDLVAKGYRWVTVDGPYACVSRDDLPQISPQRLCDPVFFSPLRLGARLHRYAKRIYLPGAPACAKRCGQVLA